MPTKNQLIRHGREEKRRTDRTRASDQCPQKQGVCLRVSTRTPKKPNSALRGNRSKNKGTFIHLFWMKILLNKSRVRLLAFFFGVLPSILTIFIFCVSYAAAATGEIVMAHPSTSSSFLESTGEIDALMATTTPSGEPSVNQATPSSEPSVNQARPELPPVQPEVAQQAQLQEEIREEILQQYLRYILRHSPWMKKNIPLLFEQNLTDGVRFLMAEYEVELLSINELGQFLEDIRTNPQQLHSFFKDLWWGPGA